MSQQLNFFEKAALVYRLSHALKKRSQEVVFLVGSALSTPVTPGAPGVVNSDGIVDLIRQEFSDDPVHLAEFSAAIDAAGPRKYQAAFLFLQSRSGQSIANEIVRKAVLGARLVDPEFGSAGQDSVIGTDEDCRLLEVDSQWALNPGTEAIGKLVAHYPERFGRSLLTTNFDPLAEVAIHKAGGQYFKTTLQADGDLSQTEAVGCHVVHLHGSWYGSDTLHTTRQLQQSRPRLKASLAALLRDRLIVVSGYGGWDDVFTEALVDVVREDSARPEILWTFDSVAPSVGDILERKLIPGIDRGRVSLYSGVDCNVIFPELYESWRRLVPEVTRPKVGRTNSVRVRDSLRRELEKRNSKVMVLEGDDEDRPPEVTICVGRETELQQLRDSNARVVFLTGIGGQGKSTVASQYFNDSEVVRKFGYFVWRDCKEESERFENQLASVIESLSHGRISGEDLAKQDAPSIVRLFLVLTDALDALFVFDNADHYVNLEAAKMTAGPDLLIQALLSFESQSRVIFTCRPTVNYQHSVALSCPLQGISIDAARRLFSERGAVCNDAEIQEAYELTDGHAFWLDLLSIQVAKSPSVTLGNLVETIRHSSGALPDNTLSSIWTTLKDKERLVLRSMAETVRPHTQDEIALYLQSKLNYHKVVRTLNALRSLNLVVVKRRPSASDLLELHPLVRHFIRKSFSKIERTSFIDEILKVYARFMGIHKSELSERPTLTTLQYWTQAAELDVASGKIAEAFDTLLEAAAAFATSAYSREFSRAVRLLLDSFDWVTHHSKFKGFDNIFRIHLMALSHLGETTEVDKLLDKFELTVVDRDSRYILYCDMKCYSQWERGELADAVKWGEIGQTLKTSTNVDTKFDVSHNLALARRDAGHPELALPVFLAGRSVAEVIDPEEFDEKKRGEHYGNIGRCLYMMGQFDSAIVCYQKSAILIEKDPVNEHFINQGFIRRWIAEVLIARNEFRLASIFLEAARVKWEQVAPPRAAQVIALQRQLKPRVTLPLGMSSYEIERICQDWISGRYMDAEIAQG
jgi:hypothetical protein